MYTQQYIKSFGADPKIVSVYDQNDHQSLHDLIEVAHPLHADYVQEEYLILSNLNKEAEWYKKRPWYQRLGGSVPESLKKKIDRVELRIHASYEATQNIIALKRSLSMTKDSTNLFRFVDTRNVVEYLLMLKMNRTFIDYEDKSSAEF